MADRSNDNSVPARAESNESSSSSAWMFTQAWGKASAKVERAKKAGLNRGGSRIGLGDLNCNQDVWKPEVVYGNLLDEKIKGKFSYQSSVSERSSMGHRSRPFKKLNAIEQRIQELSQQEEDSLFVIRFNSIVGIVILLNAFAMGAELEYGPRGEEVIDANRKIIWLIVESLFICFFLVEILIRMWWERDDWPRSWWNWLDTVVVCCAVLETWILPFFNSAVADLSMLTLLRIVRLVRLIRVVRLVRMFRGMYAMACAFHQALASMVWVCCIMVIGMFVCAIFTTTMIGQNSKLEDVVIGNDTARDRFGTLPQSIYSLFELMTLEGWHEVGRPLVVRQPFLFIFIFAYIMVFTFGLLNMIVAIVVEKTLRQAKNLDHLDQKEAIEKILDEVYAMKIFFEESDVNYDGRVTKEEFLNGMSTSSTIRECLEKIGMSVRDPVALWSVLDRSGKGEISVEDLMEGVLKAQTSRDIVWDVIHTNALMLGIQREVVSAREMQEKTLDEMEARRKAQSEAAMETRARLEKIQVRQAETSHSVGRILERLKDLQRKQLAEREHGPHCHEHRSPTSTPPACLKQAPEDAANTELPSAASDGSVAIASSRGAAVECLHAGGTAGEEIAPLETSPEVTSGSDLPHIPTDVD